MKENFFKRIFRAVPVKIILPAELTVVLFVLTIFLLILPRVEVNMMERKRDVIRELTQMAYSVCDFFQTQANEGNMSEKQAKDMAKSLLKHMRYGADLKDYFWINDMQPKIVMHPYRPDLEGKDSTTIVDPEGKHLFVEFVRKVESAGEGFVDYMWQWNDFPDRIVQKISFVKGFAPWNWVVGTGIYVEDVKEEINSITRKLTMICLGILVLIMILSTYIIWESVGVENERRKAEQALRKSEEKYRLLAETAREIIITFNLNGRITYINRAGTEILGYSREYLLTKDITDLIPEDRLEEFTAHSEASNEFSPENYIFETELLNSDNDSFPVEITSTVLYDHEKPSGVFITARDVTEKKRAEEREKRHREQLYQADKMATLGTLASGMAHEINNPITSVMLNAKTLKTIWDNLMPLMLAYEKENESFMVGAMRFDTLCERMPMLLSDIQGCAVRVKNIVGELKEFAQQRPSERNEAVDVNQAVQKSIGIVSNLISKSTNRFVVSCEENLPVFQGNSQRIEQVIINLLVNACQSLPDSEHGMSVSTAYDPEAGIIRVEVSDEGAGVSPDILKRITDPFFTTKREKGGTGLGLAISNRIVEDHGGELSFDSAPDKGTRVTVCIPVTKT